MQISRLELSLLRLSDGIASNADLQRLRQHFDETQLNAWRQVSSVTAQSIQPMETVPIDVSESVMQFLHGESADDGRALSSLDRAVLRSVLTDSHTPDLSDQILTSLSVNDSPLSEQDVDTSKRETEGMPEEWSYNGLLTSILVDDSVDQGSLTDSIMSTLNLVDTTVQEDILTDSALLKALENELNQSLETDSDFSEDASISKSSSMSFEHEIPSPVIAQKDLVMELDELSLIVEFTEEEEFARHTVEPTHQILEEDSDEEVCMVEEEFVTAEMLAEQDGSLTELHSILLVGAETDIDVWSGIVNEVNQPPLRLLREDSEVEVVDKVPTSISEDDFYTPIESAANVEFLSSKSIDADSTISKVSITVLGSFLAVAAAWVIIVLPSLLTQTTSTIDTPKRLVTFEVAEVNQLEVEDLEVGEDMNVQILQGDANAPTIIFLDDMEPL